MPDSPDFRWSRDVDGLGIGGLAATRSQVIVTGRDALDRMDVIQCLDADTGEELWRHTYLAEGNLDYGNSPRATPLIHEGHVYSLGAFGHLNCIELDSGLVVWQRNIAADFAAADLVWGHSGSPMIIDDKLIVQPGGPAASLVALDPQTGETIWSTPGKAASYSSFVPLRIAGVTQLVGLDADSMGGWDPVDGRRLWSLVPERAGDFNVPTTIVLDQKIVATSENNGTRLYQFDEQGQIAPRPLASNDLLAPDTHTPVVCNGWLVGAWNGLVALSLSDNFATVDTIDDPALMGYASLIAGPKSVLALTESGDLLLIAVDDDSLRITSRLRLADDNAYVLAHPALVNQSLYLRIENQVHRLDLTR